MLMRGVSHDRKRLVSPMRSAVEERRSTGNYFNLDLRLPEEYVVRFDPDSFTLHRADGSLVGNFFSHGLDIGEIARKAWEDVQKRKEV